MARRIRVSLLSGSCVTLEPLGFMKDKVSAACAKHKCTQIIRWFAALQDCETLLERFLPKCCQGSMRKSGSTGLKPAKCFHRGPAEGNARQCPEHMPKLQTQISPYHKYHWQCLTGWRSTLRFQSSVQKQNRSFGIRRSALMCCWSLRCFAGFGGESASMQKSWLFCLPLLNFWQRRPSRPS